MEKCLILILSSALLVLSFQNCQKVKNNDDISQSNCQSNYTSECVAANANINSLDLTSAKADLYFGADMMGANYKYRIDLTTDELNQATNSKPCSLQQNSKWQEAKQLYLKNGMCHFAFTNNLNEMACMAFAIPYAKLIDSSKNEIDMSISFCQQDFNNLCDFDSAKKFKDLLYDIEKQMLEGKACN